VAERVKASGAVMLGKTNTPEFGQLGTTENRLGPACANPWDTTRTTGGSSGGAGAALAAGLCSLATGSDAGGSIRIPASFCGVYGIKTTLGRVPRFGGVARPSPNPVSQPGPMSLTVRDSALFLNVLAGPDDRDVITLRDQPPDYLEGLDDGVGGLRMAWSPDMGFAAVDPEVAKVTSESAAVFEELGATVDEPGLKLEAPFPRLEVIGSANLYASYGHFFEERRDDLTDYVREKLEEGKGVTGAEYARALRHLEQLELHMNVLMETYDLLLTPTMAVPAFHIGTKPDTIGGREVDPDWTFNPFNLLANVTRRPAASVPCGFSSDGLPIGLQIVGRRGEESTVLRASAAFEKARPWADKHPLVS
jgi:aspartyl-tRNA(Asn)/glutamyl-tRNA(Gln) amidotransferase subunit A